jgi:curved DNA-binding protein CbpA
VLPALAYGDAEGEVARVLLCTDFFGVLEVPVTADDKEIKKAYRQKLIETHPDKNPGKARCEEAFDRVKTAFEKIGTTDNRDDYLRLLAEAHRRMHHAANSGSASSGHAPSPGARASKGPEPAPRSQGPRGRKARRAHRNHG